MWTGKQRPPANSRTPDGEGYPTVTVTYRLDDDNRFHMDWEAVTDAPTIIDMSLTYLNLNGFRTVTS
ncbi:MAG: hypothetical protein ACLR7Z_19625 [Bilophila wadsworthia]